MHACTVRALTQDAVSFGYKVRNKFFSVIFLLTKLVLEKFGISQFKEEESHERPFFIVAFVISEHG